MQDTNARRADPGGFVVAGMLLLLSGILTWDALSLRLTATYGVGPKAMSFIVAAGLALLSIGNFMLALRGEFPEREEINNTAILRILGGLAALMAVIGFGGGFIVATTLLFAMTSSAFGRKALHVDLLIGLALATVIYLVFTKLLGLSLPYGPIERVFDTLF